MFSGSGSSLLAWAAWQLQFTPSACGTLRRHVTKHFPQPPAPDCIKYEGKYTYYTDNTRVLYRVAQMIFTPEMEASLSNCTKTSDLINSI